VLRPLTALSRPPYGLLLLRGKPHIKRVLGALGARRIRMLGCAVHRYHSPEPEKLDAHRSRRLARESCSHRVHVAHAG
jgi:hypothetical protein